MYDQPVMDKLSQTPKQPDHFRMANEMAQAICSRELFEQNEMVKYIIEQITNHRSKRIDSLLCEIKEFNQKVEDIKRAEADLHP